MNDRRAVKKAANSAARQRKDRTTVVLDTGVLYAVAAPYEIEELRALAPVDFVIPPKVLWELDRLRERVETRDRSRAALNMLKGLVERGAARKSVSCGGACRLRVASLNEQAPKPGLNMDLADDCILAVAMALASRGKKVKLATTEFALYAKAAAAGLDAMYLERYAETGTVISRRERESFRLAWSRVQAADSLWSFCRRALFFLGNPLVQRLIQRVRAKQEPREVAAIIGQFDHLAQVWTPEGDLYPVIKETFGLDPPRDVDYSCASLTNRLSSPLPGVGPTPLREQKRQKSARCESRRRRTD